MKRAVAIALFCAVGGLARYYLSSWVNGLSDKVFPYGTLAVNVIGSYFIALIMELSLTSPLITPTLRIGLTVGLMGGFTTFSAFSYETYKLLENGRFLLAFANIFVSVILCLLFLWLGLMTARLMIQRGA